MSSEQLETEIATAEQTAADTKTTAETLRQELEDQCKQRETTTVKFSLFNPKGPCNDFVVHQAELEKAKALHAEELAHLTRFDEQLKDLDRAISKKKDSIADCDVQLTKIDGELKALEAQRQEALGHVKNLEKESWIQEQHQ